MKNRREVIPLIEERYNSYVAKEFAEEIELAKQYKLDRGKSWEGGEKYLKARYRKSWTGKTLPDRLRHISEVDGTISDIAVRDLDLDHLYNMYSQMAHPTPHSVVPHYGAIDQQFRTTYSTTDSTLQRGERILALLSNFSAHTFFTSFGEPLCTSLLRDHHRYLSTLPALRTWLYGESE